MKIGIVWRVFGRRLAQLGIILAIIPMLLALPSVAVTLLPHSIWTFVGVVILASFGMTYLVYLICDLDDEINGRD